MKLVLATANPDKAIEIAEVLADAGVDVELVPRPPDVPEVEETGDTLEDNARLKAVALCEATGLPAVADDTGLEVDALGRRARASTRPASPVRPPPTPTTSPSCSTRCADVPPGERTARFATVALARWPDGREVAAIGEVEGVIATEARGE